MTDVPGQRGFRFVVTKQPSAAEHFRLPSRSLERTARRRDLGINFAVVSAATEDFCSSGSSAIRLLRPLSLVLV